MSKKFAEKIIDSMVDENGFCGPRGLSVKQFNIISECLEEHEAEYAGRWYGDYSDIVFTSTDYTGRIGKYYVELNLYSHFNIRCTVKSITKSYDESEEDFEVGQTYKLSGTVKKLDEFNGVKQTILTRCRLKL